MAIIYVHPPPEPSIFQDGELILEQTELEYFINLFLWLLLVLKGCGIL